MSLRKTLAFAAVLGLVMAYHQGSVAGETGTSAVAPEVALLEQAEDVEEILEIPFSLTSVPKKAEFDLAFQVKTTGICPGTLYEPTRIWINRKAVASLNFRDRYEAGELVKYKIEVPGKKLRVGENTMKIRMGSCKKGADSIRLNGLALLQSPQS